MCGARGGYQVFGGIKLEPRGLKFKHLNVNVFSSTTTTTRQTSCQCSLHAACRVGIFYVQVSPTTLQSRRKLIIRLSKKEILDHTW